MDRWSSVILWAGICCFALSFLLSGLYPYMITDTGEPEASIMELGKGVTEDFKLLKDSWPVAFKAGFDSEDACLTQKQLLIIAARMRREGRSPEEVQREIERIKAASDAAWPKAHAQALRRGRDIFIAEGCWHCHSQYVRPVANEEVRYGPVLDHRAYNNALQRPVLFGTRRVGPDLTHEGGLRSNDWHAAHLYDPRSTTPGSVMPAYTWYFRHGWQVRRTINEDVSDREGLPEDLSYPYPGIYDSREEAERVMQHMEENPLPNLEEEAERLVVSEGLGPNPDGLALIAYLQWLGTWEPPAKKEKE